MGAPGPVAEGLRGEGEVVVGEVEVCCAVGVSGHVADVWDEELEGGAGADGVA